MTYYFLVSLIVNNSKYKMFEKNKAIKIRWMELRKNAQLFKQTKGWERAEESRAKNQNIPDEVKFLTIANVILLFSNSFLLLANIFVLFFNLPFEIEKSSKIDGYVRILLGLGCSMSWLNCVTLMATLKEFRVVS